MSIKQAWRGIREKILGQRMFRRGESDRLHLADSSPTEPREREAIGADLVNGMALGMSLGVEPMLQRESLRRE